MSHKEIVFLNITEYELKSLMLQFNNDIAASPALNDLNELVIEIHIIMRKDFN